MNISKSQKTMRVLYLYLTIPLLIITMVLGALALMSATSKKKSPETSAPADAGVAAGSAASAGSAAETPSSGPERPLIKIEQPAPKKEEESSNPAGQAAIIAAITTGITGLLGAIMQTVIAFLKRKEKRESESDEV